MKSRNTLEKWPRRLRDQGVRGSNPLAPTNPFPENNGLRDKLSGRCLLITTFWDLRRSPLLQILGAQPVTCGAGLLVVERNPDVPGCLDPVTRS